jgi:hypothetical protein
MGQRYVELETSYTAFQANNTAIIHVRQLPPNPAIIVPGPALVFVVVNGVPSVGLQVMLGSGQLGAQPILPVVDLPASSVVAAPNATKPDSSHASAARAPVSRVGLEGVLLWCAFVFVACLS